MLYFSVVDMPSTENCLLSCYFHDVIPAEELVLMYVIRLQLS